MASTVKRLLFFALCLGLPFVVGNLCLPFPSGSRLACGGQTLMAPSFVWTESIWQGLFIMMGWAMYIALQAKGGKREKAFAATWYVLQLILLGIWGGLFFKVAAWASSVFVLLLDAVVGTCALSFHKISSSAAIFLAPYLAWLLYATCLNIRLAVAG